MAERKIYIGTVGPFLYDDEDLMDDPDFPGETYGAFKTNAEIFNPSDVPVTGDVAVVDKSKSPVHGDTIVYNSVTNMYEPGPAAPIVDLSSAWPVGSIFISANSLDPAVLLGFGSWKLVAAGNLVLS
jgi:hypothetical protein